VLWLKAFHIIFVVTWFAGLFYLPRLFVYHVDATDQPSLARFLVMERRLLAITHIGGALALLFGLLLLYWWISQAPAYLNQVWLHVKLTLVALLIGYHVWCALLVRRFAAGRNRHSGRWYRLFNEIPALLLVAVVVLAVVKPL
jgi:protoporphyrinogen IX oxidase